MMKMNQDDLLTKREKEHSGVSDLQVTKEEMSEDGEALDKICSEEEMNENVKIPDGASNKGEEDLQRPLGVFIKEEPEVQVQDEDLPKHPASSYSSSVSKREQRACIKFCVKLEKTASETLKMLREAFGEEAMSCRQCSRWHLRFRTGHTSLEDDKRSGRPRKGSEYLHKILQIVSEDRSLSFREMSKIAGLNCPAICRRTAVRDLKLHRICGKLVPKSLSSDEKRERVNVCLDLRTAATADPTFISRIISCGESWFYGCHSVSKGRFRCKKCQCSKSGIPWPKKLQGRLPSRGLLVVFFDMKGIVHWEFSPCIEALSAEFYCEILTRLREAMREKRPTLWQNSNWMLHHDNSPAHNAVTTNEFLAANSVTVVPHPQMSCASDLIPWDCTFMEGLKMRMKARAIKIPEKFLPALEKDLCALKVKDFQDAFQRLQTHWELCINSQGDYCTEGQG